MKTILFVLILLTSSAFAQSRNEVTASNGSTYSFFRQTDGLTIMAKHKMADGTIRRTQMMDLNGDGQVDIAFVENAPSEQQSMRFHRKFNKNPRLASEWDQEWDEAVFRIEEETGQVIGKAGQR